LRHNDLVRGLHLVAVTIAWEPAEVRDAIDGKRVSTVVDSQSCGRIRRTIAPARRCRRSAALNERRQENRNREHHA
jgi:hypothetical protein